MEPQYKSDRHVGFDIVRTTAIILVILCHVTESVYPLYTELIPYSVINQLFAYCCFSVGRLGVPLFLFLTGSLMLNKTYDTDACIQFWKKKWLPLLLTWELWIVFYNVCNYWIDATPIDFGYLLGQMLLLKYVPMMASWYMPMILGVYLFIPFISTAINKIKPKALLFPLSIGYVYCFVVPTVQMLFPSLQLLNRLDLSFGGSTYGIYILMGYVYSKYNNIQMRLLTKILLFLPMFAVTVYVQLYFLHKGTPDNVWYTQAFLPLMALLLFSFLSQMHHFPLKKLCATISLCSFGIYLVHIPILNTFLHIFSLENMSYPLRTIVCFCFTFIFSFLTVFVLSKITSIRKILFNMNTH